MTRLPHILCFALFTASLQALPAAVVAYWNFNDLSIGSSSLPGTGGAPTAIAANQGSGNLLLSDWLGNLDDYAGTSLNTLGADPADSSLSLIAASGTPGNGSSILIQFSMSGLSNPILSFATQGTSTGFNSNQISTSTDGSNFTDFGSAYTPDSSYSLQSFDLSSVDSLDGASSAYLKVTFAGASGSTGNNRIDNLQITTIPEPSALILAPLGISLILFRRRRPTSEGKDSDQTSKIKTQDSKIKS